MTYWKNWPSCSDTGSRRRFRTVPYTSLIFAQWKPHGKLRILMDLSGINYLLKNDYNQHNHPVTTKADAAQQMAGKKYFCKHDCSQAYHCRLQMLSINTASCIQLWQLNLCVPPACSRVKHIFVCVQQCNPTVPALEKAAKCAQYVDNIGIAANNVDQLIVNIEAVFQQIHKAGLKLSMSKCPFGHPKIEFLGRSITSKGIAPLEDRIDKLLEI